MLLCALTKAWLSDYSFKEENINNNNVGNVGLARDGYALFQNE